MYYSTSVMQYLVAFALMTGSHQLVLAQNNDGGTPCVSGSCSWDMPTSSGQSGTLQIVRFHSHMLLRHTFKIR